MPKPIKPTDPTDNNAAPDLSEAERVTIGLIDSVASRAERILRRASSPRRSAHITYALARLAASPAIDQLLQLAHAAEAKTKEGEV